MNRNDWHNLHETLDKQWTACTFTVNGVIAYDLVQILSVMGHTIYKSHKSGASSFHEEKWYMKAACGEEWRIGASPYEGIYEFRCAPWVREKREREAAKKEPTDV